MPSEDAAKQRNRRILANALTVDALREAYEEMRRIGKPALVNLYMSPDTALPSQPLDRCPSEDTIYDPAANTVDLSDLAVVLMPRRDTRRTLLANGFDILEPTPLEMALPSEEHSINERQLVRRFHRLVNQARKLLRKVRAGIASRNEWRKYARVMRRIDMKLASIGHSQDEVKLLDRLIGEVAMLEFV